MTNFNERIARAESALAANPKDTKAIAELASVYAHVGDWKAALYLYARARELAPEDPRHHDDYLYFLHHSPTFSEEMLFEEHLHYGKLFTGKELPLPKRTPHTREANAKIRIGYLSHDLHEHATAFLLLPILEAHDKTRLEVYIYSTSEIVDGFTEKFQGATNYFRDVSQSSPEKIREKILSDEIDILIDMGGHTGGNSLPVFALRAAPIQISWFGYMGTSGLTTMDYRLTDEWRVPKDREKFYTEKLLYLPNSYIFTPEERSLPALSPLPALTNNFVTFGSFNTSHKLNGEVLDAWCEILRTVPTARLKMIIPASQEYEDWIVGQVEMRGVARERITPVWNVSLADLFNEIATVDIALDTFPYTAGMTAYHSLSMGVPTVTLEGTTEYARNCAAIMREVGLDDWIAKTPKEYSALAIEKSDNLKTLSIIREKVRGKLGIATKRNVQTLEEIFVQVKAKADRRDTPDEARG